MTIRFFGRHSPGASLLILLVATVASAADVRSPASQNWDSIVKEPRRKGRSLSIRIYLFRGCSYFRFARSSLVVVQTSTRTP
jgi:hypothetical protein